MKDNLHCTDNLQKITHPNSFTSIHTIYIKWYQQVPGLVMFYKKKKKLIYLSFNIISFEMMSLYSNTPVLAFPPLLESNQEVVFF